MTAPENPSAAKAGQRPLTPKEEIQRHAAVACSGTSALACEKNVHVGIFFDGTNNNMARDKAQSPPSHSNVVTSAVLLRALDPIAPKRQSLLRSQL